MPINQPSNILKLTNVSVVRLKKGGKRFEIACYKNKVKEYRSGIETDLSEVLQISNVFTNVSKGQTCSSDELKKAFGDKDVDAIVLEILKKGELQVGEKERSHELDQLRREIATLVAEKCVDPETQRPHTVTMIEKAMNSIHFACHTNKSAKSQALELIKSLTDSSTIPLARASMRIRITTSPLLAKKLKPTILPLCSKIETDETDSDWELIALIDPGQFKVLNELLQAEGSGKGGARIETLSFSTAQQGDEMI